MRKVLSIIYYEYKMQIKRIATWGILLAATVIALLDNFPSAGNLARLEFLTQPAYFIYRTMNFDALIMSFGLMFLLSNRFPIDNKTGVKDLLMAAPVQKGQYIMGKLLAALLYTFTMLCFFLALNTAVYCIAASFEISVGETVHTVMKTIFVSIAPVSVFIGFCSVALPALMDIRLFYLLFAVFFVFNASYVGSAGASPFYLITSGELIHLVWVHPKSPQIDMGSALSNLAFLVGGGLLSCVLPFLKRGFWRTK